MAIHEAIVSIGSNIEPEENIRRAIAIIREQQHLVAESSMIPTKPVGLVNQPDFINGALLVQTDMDYASFNCFLKDVEAKLERVRKSDSFGPRTIDLDIIVWDLDIVHADFRDYEHTRIPVSELIDRYRLGIKGYRV